MRAALDAAAEEKKEWTIEKESVKYYSVWYRRPELYIVGIIIVQ